MTRTKLAKILEVLSLRRQNAQRDLDEANQARLRITDEIADHQRRMNAQCESGHVDPARELLLRQARHDARALLRHRIVQLEALLAQYDEQQWRPKLERLEKAAGEEAAMQTLIDRRAEEDRKARDRAEQRSTEEAALQTWSRGREPR